MKKTLILFMIFSILSVNFLMPNASAASNLSHKQMSDIYGQGYHNALLETVVEVNAKASTRLEENRDTLTQYYEDTKSYISQRIQDYGNVSNFGELLIEQASGAMTLADGVLEVLSSLFSSDDETPPVTYPDKCDGSLTPVIADNDYWDISIPSVCSGIYMVFDGKVAGGLTQLKGSSGYRLRLSMSGTNQFSNTYVGYSQGSYATPYNFSTLDSVLRRGFNGRAYLVINDRPMFGETEIDNRPIFYKNYFNNLKSNPSTMQPVYIPQLQPKLSCPDGDKIVRIDGRGGFVHLNGVPVNSDGCTVYWQKPIVTVDDGGKVLLTDPDTGETIDAGIKPPKDKIPVEDKGEGCDSVLCFLGGVTSGIADLISTIMGLVGDLLEGLLRLFVPESLDFVQEKFDETKAKFEQKFAILNTLMDVFGGLSAHESENILMNYTFSLPITGDKEYKLFEFEAINNFIPYMKRFVSGILIMYTLLFVYRKIVGNGGVMEK